MLSCWKGEENERPNFEEIVKMLDSLLINKGKSKLVLHTYMIGLGDKCFMKGFQTF